MSTTGGCVLDATKIVLGITYQEGWLLWGPFLRTNMAIGKDLTNGPLTDFSVSANPSARGSRRYQGFGSFWKEKNTFETKKCQKCAHDQPDIELLQVFTALDVRQGGDGIDTAQIRTMGSLIMIKSRVEYIGWIIKRISLSCHHLQGRRLPRSGTTQSLKEEKYSLAVAKSLAGGS